MRDERGSPEQSCRECPGQAQCAGAERDVKPWAASDGSFSGVPRMPLKQIQGTGAQRLPEPM